MNNEVNDPNNIEDAGINEQDQVGPDEELYGDDAFETIHDNMEDSGEVIDTTQNQSGQNEGADLQTLQLRLAELQKQIQAMPEILQQQVVAGQQRQQQQVQKPQGVALTDAEYEEALSSKEGLAKVLDYHVGRKMEEVYANIGNLISATMSTREAVSTAASRFYKENPDLSQHTELVHTVANMVHSQNPGLTLDDLFKATASRTRQLLKTSGRPVKAPGSSSRPGQRPMGKFGQELAALKNV